MPTEIRRFDVASTVRMAAVLGAASGIVAAVGLLLETLQYDWARLTVIEVVGTPLFVVLASAVSFAIGGLLFALVYNAAAKGIGGVEVRLSK